MRGCLMNRLSNLKLKTSFKNISEYNEAQRFISERNKVVITRNINELLQTMEANNHAQQAKQLKDLIIDENGKVISANYNIAKKFINEKKNISAVKTTKKPWKKKP